MINQPKKILLFAISAFLFLSLLTITSLHFGTQEVLAQICGDWVCDMWAGEDCSWCPSDCGSCTPPACAARGVNPGDTCDEKPLPPNFCCSVVGGSGVCNYVDKYTWNGDCTSCDYAGFEITPRGHPCSWLPGCSGCGGPTCNYSSSYNTCIGCPVGHSKKIETWVWSDGSGDCKYVEGNCDQPDVACGSTKTCDLTEERNECCGDGLSLHVKRYQSVV